MQPEFITMTPEMASRLLENNYENNRKINKSHVNAIAQDMIDGQFNSANGQTIVKGYDGKLYDGQHRLSAQIKAGATITWLVITIDDGENAFLTIDQNYKRYAKDYFNDVKYRNAFTAVASCGFCLIDSKMPILSAIQNKQKGNINITRANTIAFGNKNKESLIADAQNAETMRYAIGKGSSKVYGFFSFIVKYINRDDCLDEFIEDLRNEVPASKTLIALKQKVLASYASKTKPTNPWLLGVVIDAYEHFRLFDEATKLNKGMTRIKQYEELVIEKRDKNTGR